MAGIPARQSVRERASEIRAATQHDLEWRRNFYSRSRAHGGHGCPRSRRSRSSSHQRLVAHLAVAAAPACIRLSPRRPRSASSRKARARRAHLRRAGSKPRAASGASRRADRSRVVALISLRRARCLRASAPDNPVAPSVQTCARRARAPAARPPHSNARARACRRRSPCRCKRDCLRADPSRARDCAQRCATRRRRR
jgi:hypothetical protein